MSAAIIWDLPLYYKGGARFIPEIGKNTIEIKLEAHLHADLNWKIAKEQAQDALKENKSLFWQIDFGLFSPYGMPIDHATQFLSFRLSLAHFRDTLWREFQAQSLGLSLYQGEPDFSSQFKWSEGLRKQYLEWSREYFGDIEENSDRLKFFCRDALSEYLMLLARSLPDEMPSYASFDLTTIKSPLAQLQLLYPECWEGLHLHLRGSLLPFTTLGKEPKLAKVGICLPAKTHYPFQQNEQLSRLLHQLQNKQVPYRLISEAALTSQWDGLDYLFFSQSATSSSGARKIAGFVAAGGESIAIEEYDLGSS